LRALWNAVKGGTQENKAIKRIKKGEGNQRAFGRGGENRNLPRSSKKIREEGAGGGGLQFCVNIKSKRKGKRKTERRYCGSVEGGGTSEGKGISGCND